MPASADLPAQRVRAAVSAAVLEPAVLPRFGVPTGSPPLAGGAAAGQAPPGRRGESPARPGRAGAPRAGQIGVSNCGGAGRYAGAWSRSKRFFSPPLCGRPGCHEPPLKSLRNPARYCCRACRHAVANVLDRERKWRARGTLDGRTKRAYEYHASRLRQSGRRCATSATASSRAPPE
jgi:hypothetical protein